MRIDWVKRPTYEEIVRDLEKDYKVKLPDRVALKFYDSFAHTHSFNRCNNLLVLANKTLMMPEITQ